MWVLVVTILVNGHTVTGPIYSVSTTQIPGFKTEANCLMEAGKISRDRIAPQPEDKVHLSLV